MFLFVSGGHMKGRQTGQYKTRTADCGLRTGYKIQTRYETRTRYKTRTADGGLGIKYGVRTALVKTVQLGSR